MQTELHRHLDVSTRLSTLLELAQKQGLEGTSTSLEAFRSKVIMTRPMTDLNSVLAQFTLFQKVLDRPETLERIAFETVEDCWNEGTRKVELRFSPSFVSEFNGLSWEEVLDAFERGVQKALQRYPDMKAGLLCIASRDFGVDQAAKTAEFFLKHQTRFAGLDLAGNEIDWPCRLFQGAFQETLRKGARITVHAGEACGPENMWEAIEVLGAQRIGHGIAAIRDPQLMEELRKRAICLEICPTSNWLTQAVPSLEEHPLPRLLRAGVPVSINTDDPGIFATTVPGEEAICRRKMGMSEAEIAQCQNYADKASFLRS